jgi:hypothetical protein
MTVPDRVRELFRDGLVAAIGLLLMMVGQDSLDPMSRHSGGAAGLTVALNKSMSKAAPSVVPSPAQEGSSAACRHRAAPASPVSAPPPSVRTSYRFMT